MTRQQRWDLVLFIMAFIVALVFFTAVANGWRP